MLDVYRTKHGYVLRFEGEHAGNKLHQFLSVGTKINGRGVASGMVGNAHVTIEVADAHVTIEVADAHVTIEVADGVQVGKGPEHEAVCP